MTMHREPHLDRVYSRQCGLKGHEGLFLIASAALGCCIEEMPVYLQTIICLVAISYPPYLKCFIREISCTFEYPVFIPFIQRQKIRECFDAICIFDQSAF